MKRSELFFNAVFLPIDYIALLMAGVVAYYLRVSPLIQRVRPAVFTVDLPFGEYMQLIGVVAAVIVTIFAMQGMYAMHVRRRLMDEITGIFTGISFGVLLVILYIFFAAELFQSRFLVVTAYLLAILFVAVARFLIHRLQMMALRRGFGVYRVVLVGNGLYGAKLAEVLRRWPTLGYRVVAELDTVNRQILEQLWRHPGIDEVIQTDPKAKEEDNLIIVDFCDEYKIDYKYVPNLFATVAANVRFRQLGGVPVVELLHTPLDGWGRITKRMMDIVGAILGLIVLAPLFLVIALLSKLDSAGPVFYHHTRMGKYKQPFEMYKFRTMYLRYCTGLAYGGQSAEAFEQNLRRQTNERSGPLFKMRQDPRITPMGRFLRRWRIDELPQLFNVLRGQMSLLGPRPHLSQEVARYDKHHQKLFTIKPGMSGMAQVHGSSGLTFSQEAKLDIGYIETWSLQLDFVLLLKTFRILLTDRNAV